MRRRKTYKEAVTTNTSGQNPANQIGNNTRHRSTSNSFFTTGTSARRPTYRGSYPQKINTISYEQHQKNLKLAKEAEEEKEEINISKLTTLTITDNALKSTNQNTSQESLTSEGSDKENQIDKDYEQIDPKELVVENGWTIC